MGKTLEFRSCCSRAQRVNFLAKSCNRNMGAKVGKTLYLDIVGLKESIFGSNNVIEIWG